MIKWALRKAIDRLRAGLELRGQLPTINGLPGIIVDGAEGPVQTAAFEIEGDVIRAPVRGAQFGQVAAFGGGIAAAGRERSRMSARVEVRVPAIWVFRHCQSGRNGCSGATDRRGE